MDKENKDKINEDMTILDCLVEFLKGSKNVEIQEDGSIKAIKKYSFGEKK